MSPLPLTDAIIEAELGLTEVLERLARLADEATAKSPVGWRLVGALVVLRHRTAPEWEWHDTVAVARPWLIHARTSGPLDLGGLVACCAAQLVVDLTDRIEDIVAEHPSLAEALDGFGEAYSDAQLVYSNQACSSARGWDGSDDVDTRPARPAHPPDEPTILCAAWTAGERDMLGTEPADYLLRQALTVRRTWDTDGGRVHAAITEHLRTVSFPRLRAEVEWECNRAVTECEFRLPDRPGGRDPDADRPAAEVQRDQRMDDRDRWIYEQVVGGQLTYDAIMRQLRREAQARGWRPLGSPEAIRQRAIRYSEQHQLPPPKPRQSR